MIEVNFIFHNTKMNIYIILIPIYIISLLWLVYMHNKIITDSKKILQTISQAIDNITQKLTIYINNNGDKIPDQKTLQEIIFSAQKQYINGKMDLASKKVFYGKLTENLEYIYNLTWDDLRDPNSQESANKWFKILEDNQKTTMVIKTVVSIFSLWVLYLFCNKL